MSRSLVIFLHGVGSRGADLAPLGAAWSESLTDTIFAAPDAPYPFDQGGSGRQWFSVRGVTELNRPERVLAARAAFDRLIGDVIASHGFDGQLDRVALVGFSQGSIMALDAVASGRCPVVAVVAFAGRLASPEPLDPATGTKLLIVHGDADPVMPVRESEIAEVLLSEAGVDVRRLVLHGVGHWIPTQGAASAADFLADVFSLESMTKAGAIE